MQIEQRFFRDRRLLIMKMFRVYKFVFLLIFGIQISGVAQETPLSKDSTVLVPPSKKIKDKKQRVVIPKRSLKLSLIFPGAGQIYNGRWWKAPLVYGALGGVIYAIDYNTGQYQRLRDALVLKRANETHEFSGTSIDNINSLQSLRDGFDKNRQLSYIGLVVVYALQAIEAFVDGHLQNFDTDEDISFRVKPILDFDPHLTTPVYGLGISVPIGKQKSTPRSIHPHFTSP